MKKITLFLALLGLASYATAQDSAAVKKLTVDKSLPALAKVEKPATLPDGGIQVFFKKKFIYPPRTNYTGNVVVNYIVEVDGSLSDVKVVTPCPDKMIEEVVRVVTKSSGLWKPAQHEGETVRQLVSTHLKIVMP
jgi:protein TonB